MNWPKRWIYGSSGFSVTSIVPFHLVDELSWMGILAVCHAWGVLPFWSWKREEKCREAKSVSFSLHNISKTKCAAVSGVSTFSLEAFIFQVACGLGVLVRSAEEEGGSISRRIRRFLIPPPPWSSLCSPQLPLNLIDFWQVLVEEMVPVIRLVSEAMHGAGDLVRKEKHREQESYF